MSDTAWHDAMGVAGILVTGLFSYLKVRQTTRRWAEDRRVDKEKLAAMERKDTEARNELERDSRIMELKQQAEDARVREDEMRKTLDGVEKEFRRRIKKIEDDADRRVDEANDRADKRISWIRDQLDKSLEECRRLRDLLAGSEQHRTLPPPPTDAEPKTPTP